MNTEEVDGSGVGLRCLSPRVQLSDGRCGGPVHASERADLCRLDSRGLSFGATKRMRREPFEWSATRPP